MLPVCTHSPIVYKQVFLCSKEAVIQAAHAFAPGRIADIQGILDENRLLCISFRNALLECRAENVSCGHDALPGNSLR